MKITSKLWIGIIFLALLSPLGLFLPHYFNSDGAWGEWSAERLKALTGYSAQGLERLSGRWKAPLADYSLNKPFGAAFFLYLEYFICAFLGILAVCLLTFLISKFLIKKK